MKKIESVLIKIKIQNNDFDVSKETKQLNINKPGAIVNFIGIVRGIDDKTHEKIYSMTLEHYPGMTEAEIETILRDASKRWKISAITVIHRVGKLFSSDQIVFVGVASKHRQNAFDACNYIMDWLKNKAPFWKIEESSKEKKWVKFNVSDDDALKKWTEGK
jgi:molybdopterin synthase catalytic subunit|tara:strand:- start:372 stop:854 length:483 start_codon:yes stop_codon:yes gene_type:complete